MIRASGDAGRALPRSSKHANFVLILEKKGKKLEPRHGIPAGVNKMREESDNSDLTM
jgi:hypothetical protein